MLKTIKVRLIGLALTLGLLAGCETLLPMATSLLGGAAKDGISVDAQVGDRENEGTLGKSVQKGSGDIKAEDDAQVTVNNKQESSDARIENAKTVKVQNIPPWVFLLAVLGWILPTPVSMFKWVWNKIPFTSRKS